MLEIFNQLITQGFEKFGRYYSSYRGYVVDNEDPDGFGRIKVMIPQITGRDVINYWAWPKGMFSGKGYGMQCTPQKNDMVWVEFEYGSPRKPIYHFGHFANQKDDKTPEKDPTLKDIKNFWFKTPGGHLIEFDDTNKWVKITSSKGGIIKLDDNLQLLKGTSPAVLGDKNNDTQTKILDTLTKISTLLGKIQTADTAPTTALATALGITLTYPTQISTDLPAIQQDIADIQTKIQNNNSTTITLS